MCLFAHYRALIYREGTKLAKGPLCALMGHVALHIRALIATTEPENCPRDSYFLPLTITICLIGQRHLVFAAGGRNAIINGISEKY